MMCTADLYDYPPARRALICAHDRDTLSSLAPENAIPLPVSGGAPATTTLPAVPDPLPAHPPEPATPVTASWATPLRDQREGWCLAQRGGSRILREAMEAPDERVRIARWRNRYACVPTELTLETTP